VTPAGRSIRILEAAGRSLEQGGQPVELARLSLSAPAGWTVTATSPTTFASVPPGASVQAGFQVVAPPPATLFQTDAPAGFAQVGQRVGVSGAGADLYSGSDSYSTVYLPAAVGDTSTIQAEVVSHQNLTGFGKAGILVRNDMTASGTGPEGVILFESPSGGIQLEWNNNGGTHINAVMPPNGTIADTVPVWLKLVRAGTTYTGFYSTDGTTWTTVGTATVTAQADTQDAGLFVTSHVSGSPAQAVFNTFAVTTN